MPNEVATIVVVEDDPNISELICMYLRRDGHRVVPTADGESGLAAVESERPSLVILDVGLPGNVDGFEVCRRIRADSSVAVVMLTARDEEIDRVLGFELGADDYVTKPFSPRELAARVKAIIRRSARPATTDRPVATLGRITVDTARREVLLDGAPVALATREFDLLAYLVANRRLALSRRQLLDGVWGPDWYGDDRTVDVHIGQLRKKLGPDLTLSTVWGVGYRLD